MTTAWDFTYLTVKSLFKIPSRVLLRSYLESRFPLKAKKSRFLAKHCDII